MIPAISDISEDEHANSKNVCEKLTSNMIDQKKEYVRIDKKTEIQMKKEKSQCYQQNLQEVEVEMTDEERRANNLAQAKEASNRSHSLCSPSGEWKIP